MVEEGRRGGGREGHGEDKPRLVVAPERSTSPACEARGRGEGWPARGSAGVAGEDGLGKADSRWSHDESRVDAIYSPLHRSMHGTMNTDNIQ